MGWLGFSNRLLFGEYIMNYNNLLLTAFIAGLVFLFFKVNQNAPDDEKIRLSMLFLACMASALIAIGLCCHFIINFFQRINKRIEKHQNKVQEWMDEGDWQ